MRKVTHGWSICTIFFLRTTKQINEFAIYFDRHWTLSVRGIFFYLIKMVSNLKMYLSWTRKKHSQLLDKIIFVLMFGTKKLNKNLVSLICSIKTIFYFFSSCYWEQMVNIWRKFHVLGRLALICIYNLNLSVCFSFFSFFISSDSRQKSI